MFLRKYEKPIDPNSVLQVSKQRLYAVRKIILIIDVSTKTHAHALYQRSTTKNRLTRMF